MESFNILFGEKFFKKIPNKQKKKKKKERKERTNKQDNQKIMEIVNRIESFIYF